MKVHPSLREPICRRENNRDIAHYDADGEDDGELEGVADTDADGEVDGEADTDADGDAEVDADGELDGVEDGDADEITVPTLPDRISQR